MSQDQWTRVDDYFTAHLTPEDAALTDALEAARTAGLPEIQVAPNQGAFLSILAKSVQARFILEIGTLGGYSTLWLARGLAPGGRIVTLELDPRHAEVARGNFAKAGLSDRIEVHIGPALDALRALQAEDRPPFDFVFIDADKASTADYFEIALKLTRPGALIVTDNVVRRGEVADADSADANVQGVRRFIERAAAEKTATTTAIQTVGSKGYDGFAISLVTG